MGGVWRFFWVSTCALASLAVGTEGGEAGAGRAVGQNEAADVEQEVNFNRSVSNPGYRLVQVLRLGGVPSASPERELAADGGSETSATVAIGN